MNIYVFLVDLSNIVIIIPYSDTNTAIILVVKLKFKISICIPKDVNIYDNMKTSL